jgi:hypothetical protein
MHEIAWTSCQSSWASIQEHSMSSQLRIEPTKSGAESSKTIYWLCAFLVLLKVAAIWYYYVPPFNVLSKLAMLAILAWFFIKSLRGFRGRKWHPFILGALFAACLLFAPFMNDVRAVGLRYRAEFEIRNWSTSLDGTGKHIMLSGGMGEGVYLEKGVVPDTVMFLPKLLSIDPCYEELIPITRDHYIQYVVCPSGTGILIVSILWLNF